MKMKVKIIIDTYIQKVISLAILLAVTVVLFKVGQAFALKERGYEAVGGEYMLLMLPIIVLSIKDTYLQMKKENAPAGREPGASADR